LIDHLALVKAISGDFAWLNQATGVCKQYLLGAIWKSGTADCSGASLWRWCWRKGP